MIEPSFGITYSELKSKFEGTNKISKHASLVLSGLNSKIKDFVLDGHVVVNDGDVVTGEHVSRNYLQFVLTADTDPDALRIRGYKS